MGDLFPQDYADRDSRGARPRPKKRGASAIAVVTGDAPEAPAAEIAKYGVAKVIALAHPALKNYLADAHAQALAALVEERKRGICDRDRHRDGQGSVPAAGGSARRTDGIGHHLDQRRPYFCAPDVRRQRDGDGGTRRTDQSAHGARDRVRCGQARRRRGSGRKSECGNRSAALKMEFVSFNATKSDRPQLTEAE